MAKKVTGYIKLQIPAGKATPAPPVGPALGQHGVNIVQFTKEFNARTADHVLPDAGATPSETSCKCKKSSGGSHAAIVYSGYISYICTIF